MPGPFGLRRDSRDSDVASRDHRGLKPARAGLAGSSPGSWLRKRASRRRAEYSRSSARPLRSFSALLLAFGLLVGCSRDRAATERPQDPVESSGIAPAGLLAEGVLTDPARVFAVVRSTLAERGLPLPSRYALAVTAFSAMPPLVAGLVDEAAPVSLAITDVKGATGAVLALRVKSGEELVVALAHGADSTFRAERDVGGVTLLRPKKSAGAAALGVFRDRLLLGTSQAHVLDAARYLARGAVVATQPGPAFVLEARKAALGKILVPAVRTSLGRVMEDLRSADRAARDRHGGKDPDFGDPAPVLQSLSRVGDGWVALLETARMARLSGFLAPTSTMRLRMEIEPDESGAARETMAALPVGSANSLLTLPASTRAVALLRGIHVADAAAHLETVLGSRLRGVDRACLERWTANAERAFGDTFEIGAYASEADSGAFLRSEHGNAEALRNTLHTLPEALAIPAIAGPIETFYGRLRADPSRVVPDTGPGVEEIAFRVAPRGRPDAGKFRIVSGADRDTAAAVVGDLPADDLRDLLRPRGQTIGMEPSVHEAVLRAGDQVFAAAVVRVWSYDGDGPEWVVLAAGTDRSSLWAEASGPLRAVFTLGDRLAGP